MAKVEMNIEGGIWPPCVKIFDEYADKVWQESELTVLINGLTKKRKTVQSKIDAMRKRLKRLTDRLNSIEEGWQTA